MRTTYEIFIGIFLTLIFVSQSLKVVSQENPSNVDPKAIVLDLGPSDFIGAFSEGFAIIKKGDKTAIIDSKGNFLIPFNKYGSVGNFVNGYATFNNNNSSGMIDKKGNEYVYDGKKGFSAGNGFFDDYGYCEMRDNQGDYLLWNLKSGVNSKTIYFSKNCQETTCYKNRVFGGSRLNINNGLILFRDDDGKYGYYGIQGSMKIQPQFTSAKAFSEGVAAVAKPNEFGEIKWGFIDTTGKIVIPFIYSNEPGNFYKNRAFVKSSQSTDFYFGFINKNNELKLKFKDYPIEENFTDGFLLFYNNYHPYFIDTSGNKLDIIQHGTINGTYYADKVIYTKNNISYVEENPFTIIVNNQIKIAGKSFTASQPLVGIITIDGKTLAPPIFSDLSYFDGVSHLAKATYWIDDKKHIDGYINEKGIFIIIKKQPSVW